ncbi:MAG: hypothetical protein INQ03_04965 [Candidatus Heimdallarchaeota archaeon]|nr:hypothetical protein [Candidatus Heimdallarchaeota archaeon]
MFTKKTLTTGIFVVTLVYLTVIVNQPMIFAITPEGGGGSTGNPILDVTNVDIVDNTIAKGQSLSVKVTVKNTGSGYASTIKFRLYVSSINNAAGQKYVDFTNVVATGYVSVGGLSGSESKVITTSISPYLSHDDFVLNAGKFEISKVIVTSYNAPTKYDTSFTGTTTFTVDNKNTSSENVVFAVVYYDQEFLDNYGSASTMLNSATKHKVSYGEGSYDYEDRFLQDFIVVKAVKMNFWSQTSDDLLDEVKQRAGDELYLDDENNQDIDWKWADGTSKYNHGYDMVIAFSGKISTNGYGGYGQIGGNVNVMMGGNTQLGIEYRYNYGEFEIRALHEIHHNYGADHVHCGIVGDGCLMSSWGQNWVYSKTTILAMFDNMNHFSGI